MQNNSDIDMDFIQGQDNSQLARIAADMVEEYKGNSELAGLIALDGEEFVWTAVIPD